MGRKSKMLRQIQTPPASEVSLSEWSDTTTRCHATHDVPYTLRCTLRADHVDRVVYDDIVQSGPHTGARVIMREPHRDKNGREW